MTPSASPFGKITITCCVEAETKTVHPTLVSHPAELVGRVATKALITKRH